MTSIDDHAEGAGDGVAELAGEAVDNPARPRSVQLRHRSVLGPTSALDRLIAQQVLLELGSSEAYRRAFRKRVRVWAEKRHQHQPAQIRDRIVRRYIDIYNGLTTPPPTEE